MPSETVKTTVSADQKAAWTEDAEYFDMSQSEFIRTMVQAGRHWIDLESSETPSQDTNPGGNALEGHVLAILAEQEPITFDEIVDSITQDIETRVDDILQSLHADGRVNHSNVDGYSLIEEPHGDD